MDKIEILRCPACNHFPLVIIKMLHMIEDSKLISSGGEWIIQCQKLYHALSVNAASLEYTIESWNCIIGKIKNE